MISIVLSIFGATFIYAGMLMFPKDANAATGSAVLGLLLIAKPCLDVVRQVRALSRGAGSTGRRGHDRHKGRHLTLVKSENEKSPTIH